MHAICDNYKTHKTKEVQAWLGAVAILAAGCVAGLALAQITSLVF